MSTVSTVFEDSQDGSMVLKFLVDGVEKTKYTYTLDGCVTLSVRKSAHINSYDSFVKGLELVLEWVKKILIVHRIALKAASKNSITKFSLGSQYLSNGNIKCLFKIGKTKVINTVYNVENKTIKFSKRPTISMCFKDFENLLHFQKYICKLMYLLNTSNNHIATDLDDEI